LRIQSTVKPSGASAVQKSDNWYELTLEPGRSYTINYRAVK
jgi:hypothetical protein